MLSRALAFLFFFTLFSCTTARAGWEKVPPMDWTGIKLADFSDQEISVPYYLEHFHTVANAVVEEGENRGYIGIAVHRDPAENKPFNARVQENTVWFAYLYASKKPWNPYYGSPAVRQRLEAMLDFWCRSQGPEGLFSEYKPQAWGLATTSFGTLFMSQTLDLLQAPGAPPIDRAILERTMQAQRKALYGVFTNDYMRRIAVGFHNQYTGTYRAMIRYLQTRPDPALEATWIEYSRWAAANTQSPAGFFYEGDFPDFGYSRVHDGNLQYTEPLLSSAPASIREKLIVEYRRYNEWLAPNFLLEPDGSGYFLNAGVQNRTAHAYQGYAVRPMARLLPETWPFSVTDAEFRASLADRRKNMEKEWPKQMGLTVFAPHALFRVIDGLPQGLPTQKQRDAAIAKLPYMARSRYAQVRLDTRTLGVLYVRRPSYYAALNFGRSEDRDRPVMGLGLLWNDAAGTVSQALPAPADSAWGVKLDGQERYVESRTLRPTITVGGKVFEPKPGVNDLPDGEVAVTWPLGDTGKKTVVFEQDRIRVDIEAKGGFVEQIPLLLRTGDTIARNDNQIVRTRGAHRFLITANGGRMEIVEAGGETPDIRRPKARITGTDRLRYTLAFPAER